MCACCFGEETPGMAMARQEDALASEYQVLEELGSKSPKQSFYTFISILRLKEKSIIN